MVGPRPSTRSHQFLKIHAQAEETGAQVIRCAMKGKLMFNRVAVAQANEIRTQSPSLQVDFMKWCRLT